MSCKFKDICPVYNKTSIPCIAIFDDPIFKLRDYETYCIPLILEMYNNQNMNIRDLQRGKKK